MFMRFLVALLFLSFSACTRQQGCDAQIRVAQQTAKAIAEKMRCDNLPKITEDLTRSAAKAGFCAPAPSPSPVDPEKLKNIFVNSVTCSFFGKMAVEDLASKNIPDEWGCDTAVLVEPLKDFVVRTCNRYF